MRAWQALSSGWTAFAIPTNIQKRLYKFLLRKSIGRFLAQELDLENFDVELINGSIEMRDLDLNLEVLNELISETPFTITEGYIGGITASLPWSNFWSGDIVLEMRGLRITLKPELNKPKKDKQKMDEEPVLSTSIHLAGDFLKTEVPPDEDEEFRQSIHLSTPDSPPFDPSNQQNVNVEGLQVLTKVIDKMLARIKIKIIDSVLRIHHVSTLSLSSDVPNPDGNMFERETHDYYLDIQMPSISYFDETPGLSDRDKNEPTPPDINMQSSSILLPPAINESIKILVISSPTIWIRSGLEQSVNSLQGGRYPEMDTSVAESAILSNQSDTELNDSSMFHSAIGDSQLSGSITPQARPASPNMDIDTIYESLIFSTMDKDNWFRFKFSSGEAADWPTTVQFSDMSSMKQVDVIMSSLCIALSPKQMVWLNELLECLSGSAATPSNDMSAEYGTAQNSPQDQNADVLKELMMNKNDADKQQEHMVNSPAFIPQSPSYMTANNHAFNFGSPSRYENPLGIQQLSLEANREQWSSSMKFENPPGHHSGREGGRNLGFSTLQHQKQAIPPLKVKFSMTAADLYILMDEARPVVPPAFFSMPSPALLGVNHIRFSLQQIVLRYKDWSSLSNATSYHERKGRKNTTGPNSSDESAILCPRTALDVRISQMTLQEWLKRPEHEPSLPEFSKYHYEVYAPILQFSEVLPKTYRSQDDFPTISLADLSQQEGKREALRLKIEQWSSKIGSPGRQDVIVDIKPFQLSVDLRVIDRMEKVITTFMNQSKKEEVTSITDRNVEERYTRQTSERDIYADLKQTSEHTELIKTYNVKFAFIRLLLLTPDMSRATKRSEHTEYIHDDYLVVDIIKLSSRHVVDDSNENSHSNTKPSFGEDPLEDIDYLNLNRHDGMKIGKTGDKVQLTFECENVNVFLKKARDLEPVCWFMVKPGTDTSIAAAKDTIKLSTFQITISTGKSEPKSNSNLFNACDEPMDHDIPYAIFDRLKSDENIHNDEEKIHIPSDEQSESTSRFKKHSMDTSMFAMKCVLPLTRMNLTKETWDIVQTIQNDLLMWQPKFLSSVNNLPQDTDDSSNEVFSSPVAQEDSGHDPHSPEFDTASGQFQANEAGSESISPHVAAPDKYSLLTIMACLQRAEWTLHYPKEEFDVVNLNTYNAVMDNFQYGSVIKHKGQDENITTLDIDNVSLHEVESEDTSQLKLDRNIPALLKYKAPMVSILTLLKNQPLTNVQDKSSSIVISNLKINYDSNVNFIDNLTKFQNAPVTMNVVDPPVTYIKVYVTVKDTTVSYAPADNTLQAAIILDDLKIATDIFQNQPRLFINCQMRALDLYMVDDRSELYEEDAISHLKGHGVSASRWWRNVGMARCVAMRDFAVSVSLGMREEEQLKLDVALTNHVLGLEFCKDSLPAVLNLINAVTASTQKAEVPVDDQAHDLDDTGKTEPATDFVQGEPINMLQSLDERAFFHQGEQPGESSRRLSSDMEYVEEYYSSAKTNKDKAAANRTKADVEEMHIVPPTKPRRKNAASVSEDIIHVMDEGKNADQLKIEEDHFSKERLSVNMKPKVDVSKSVKRIRLKDFNIVCKLYDGCDWRHTRRHSNEYTVPQSAPHRPSTSTSVPLSHNASQEGTYASPVQSPVSLYKEDAEPSIDYTRPMQPRTSSEYAGEDFSDTTSQYSRFQYSVKDGKQPSSYHRRVSSSPDSHTSKLRARRIRNSRSHSARLEIRLEQINVEFDLLPVTEQLASHLQIHIRDFEIIDHIKTSMYRKFLSYMRLDRHPRERGSNMIRFELTSVRPVPYDLSEEHRLKLRIFPMRLYIDQDAILFLINFFSFDPKLLHSGASVGGQTTARSSERNPSNNDNDTFFRMLSVANCKHVEIYPVLLKVDYRPKHVNYGSLKEGQFAELVNFFHLDAAEMNLSHVKLTGIKGYDRLVQAVMNHWLPHIRDTQLGKVVTGVSSIQSVVNIGSGVADLVLLPIEQYRKDGRIIRGIQKGTQSFARTTTMEAIKIGSRLAAGTQVILEQADEYFSPAATNESIGRSSDDYASEEEPSQRATEPIRGDSDSDSQKVISKFADQPTDVSQGLQHAYQSLSKNIMSAANTVLAVPTEIQASEGPHGTARAVIRAVPIAVIRPLIGFSEAFANVLVGIRNTIDPDQKAQSVEVCHKANFHMVSQALSQA
ncbi:hypothetical protein NQZ79_g4914 [Umbelopsis isabellina]|nr:hypothetical protein NQZ79_g4914 [Umbelopsis isabellina]